MRRQWELRRVKFALSQGGREGSVKADKDSRAQTKWGGG